MKKIFAVIVCALMLFVSIGIVPQMTGAFATEKLFNEMSVNLAENISVKYYVSATLPQNAYMVASMTDKNGEVIKTTRIDGYSVANNQKVFVYKGVAPQFIGQTITAVLYDGDGTQLESLEKSTSQYLTEVIGNGAAGNKMGNEKFSALKALAANMYDYAQEAQNYYKANGGTYELNDLGGDMSALGLTTQAYELPALGKVEKTENLGCKIKSASLYLDNDISLKTTADLNGQTASGVTAVADGVNLQTDIIRNDGTCVAAVKIPAALVNDSIKITLLGENGQILTELTMRAADYIAAMNADANAGKLIKSVWNYANAVKNYGEFKEIVAHASEASHIKTNFDIGTSSYTQSGRGNGKHVRFKKDDAIEYAIIADRETENVTLSLDCFKGYSTGGVNVSVFDMFDVTLNNTALTASETQQKVTFEKVDDTALIKIATVTLQKGLNYVRLTAKGDYVRAEFLEVAYSGKEKAELAKTASFNAVDAQVIEYVSTNGVSIADRNGINTNTSYLGKFTSGSNVRLNTADYIEYTFTCDKDVTVYLGGDYSRRAIEETTNFKLFKVFIKEGEGEYTELKENDANANLQSLNFTKAYGSFQTIYFGTLEFKAGETYTLKMQARNNLHVEYVDFCYLGDATISLTNK